ncbi:MAG: sulfur carrier protein ThiS [Candidatus Riflebacteria bacterium]|nr:sulfur carrier protein ThiS [Candidatus Riflebacteria bacterium]
MIQVNGQPSEYVPEMTIRDVLKRHQFIFPLLIIKLNGEFVPREKYDTTKVNDNSEVYVLHLMSGG